MQKWPIPSTLKQLRGFLGLTGYYRRFLKDYVIITQPLVALTKKDAFKWNPSAELAYHQLKEAMVTAPVLALPNFEQEFIVETDANGKGIRAVLCQNGHPIAYWSKTLSVKHQALSTYEKEFLAVVAALDKWKGYLLDRHFKIRTDHFSLKYLLNQKLTTPFQFKWLPKLLGYDYEIVYKKGSKNVVADALSRVDSSGELLQISVSSISSGVWDKVKDSWKNDLETQNLIKSLEHHSYKGNKYSWNGEILKRKGKVVVGNDPELRKELVSTSMMKLLALFADLKVKLKLSTAYHPQTDGQTKVYNINYHTSTKTTPYEAVYCQTPPIHVPYILGDSRVEEVDRILQAREEAIKVYLKLQPHRQVSIRQGQQYKLSSKYYGPFKVTERIREVAYRLKLPKDGLLENKPMTILEKRLGKVNNKLVMFVLIQWTNKPVEEATWEIYGDLITRFLGFDAVNEAIP
ncbi:putative mitochondrial protein [Tanacetum coccineum]